MFFLLPFYDVGVKRLFDLLTLASSFY